MPVTYPPSAPIAQGDTITASKFLNTPTVIARRVADLTSQRMVALAMLSGRETTTSGSASINVDDELFTDRPVEQVAPGSEYPLTTLGDGTTQVIKTVKWGQDSIITDEAISRQSMSPVERGLSKLVNSAIKNVDGVALSLLASSVTQTHAAASAWGADDSDPLRDLLEAKAKIRALERGYEPNALVVDDLTWARLASNHTITNAMARETTSNPIVTGEFATIAGLAIWPTSHLPVGGGAWLVDTTNLGGLLLEDLGGGYTRAGDVVEIKSIRQDETDRWRVRARAVCTPFVTAPDAAIRITGV